MAAKFSLIPAAQNDLLNIRRFSLRYWGRVQASNYLRELDEIFRSLAQAPGIGRNRKDDLSIDVMSFPHKSHMIYYKNAARGILIIAVLHQSATPLKHLLDRQDVEDAT